MFKKTIVAAIIISTSAVSGFAAEFGELAGTYSGKTAKGSSITVVIPKSGTPTYSFGGSSVSVNSATLSGKTVKLSVGTGGGSVTLTETGKGKLSYKYAFKGDSASATLSKQ